MPLTMMHHAEDFSTLLPATSHKTRGHPLVAVHALTDFAEVSRPASHQPSSRAMFGSGCREQHVPLFL